MAGPDIRVRLSAEGVQEVVAALRKIQAESANTSAKSAASWKNLSGSVRTFTASLESAAAILPALLGALGVGVLIQFGRSAAEVGDEIVKMAQRVGGSVGHIAALRLLATLTDVELQQLQTGLVGFNRRAQQAAAGSGDAAKAFKALGISSKELRGLDVAERLELVAKAFGDLKDSPEKTALAFAVFGRQGAALIPLMNALSEQGLAKLQQRMKDLGITFTKDMGVASQRVSDDWKILQLQASALGQQFVTGLAPALSDAFRSLSTFLGGSGLAADGVRKFGEAIGQVIRVATGIAAVSRLILDPILFVIDQTGRLFTRLTGAVIGKPEKIDDTLRTGGTAAPEVVNTAAADRAKKAAEAALKEIQTFIDAGVTAEGRASSVAMTHIAEAADEAKKALEKLKTLSTEERAAFQAQIDKSFASQIAAAQLAEQIASIERRRNDALKDREAIQHKVTDGQISERDGEQRLAALQRDRLPTLTSLADKALAMALALKDPDMVAKVLELRDSFEQLQRPLHDSLKLAKELGAALESDIANTLEQIGTQITTLSGLLLGFLASVISSLQRIAAEHIAESIIGLFGFSEGGQVQRRAAGGVVHGPGTATSDSIPAMLSAGEYVVRASSVMKPGMLDHLEHLNRGFAMGGLAGAQQVSFADITFRSAHESYAHMASGGLVTAGDSPQKDNGVKHELTVYLADGLIAEQVQHQLGTPEAGKMIVQQIGNRARAVRTTLAR